MSELDDTELAQLREILRDAESCARLTLWENDFCSDMQDRLLQYGADTRVSDAQWKVIRRIEAKYMRDLPLTILRCWRTSWATVGTIHRVTHRSVRTFIRHGLGAHVPRRTAHVAAHVVVWSAHGTLLTCVMVGVPALLAPPGWSPVPGWWTPTIEAGAIAPVGEACEHRHHHEHEGHHRRDCRERRPIEVPEPSTLVLLAVGAVGLAGVRLVRK